MQRNMDFSRRSIRCRRAFEVHFEWQTVHHRATSLRIIIFHPLGALVATISVGIWVEGCRTDGFVTTCSDLATFPYNPSDSSQFPAAAMFIRTGRGGGHRGNNLLGEQLAIGDPEHQNVGWQKYWLP
jgi:hypothetical protein